MDERIVLNSGGDPDQPPYRVGSSTGWWIALVLLAAITIITSRGAPPIASDAPLIVEPFAPPVGRWVETVLGEDGSFTDVSVVGSRLIAVGSGLRVDARPFVWVSSGEAEWILASGPWIGGEVISALAPLGESQIAVGYRLVEPFAPEGPVVAPRVWQTEDGLTWRAEPTTGLPDRASLVGLESHAGGVTAIGWEGPGVLEPVRPPADGSIGRVWMSEDGRDWVDVTPPGGDPRFTDVLYGGCGLVVAGTFEESPAVWMGGPAWTRSVLPGDEWSGHEVVGIADDDSGLVALVRRSGDPGGLLSVWNIDEAGQWDLLHRSGSPASSGWVDAIGGDLFAGAAFTRSVYGAGPEVWVSDDGVEWFGVEITGGVSPWPPAAVTRMVGVDGDLVALGSRGAAPTVWTLAGDG